jgi:hypothetical protein
LYGKISNSKIEESCKLKSFGHSLETTFVLRIFKKFGAGGRASAPKVEKKAKQVKKISNLVSFSKVEIQKLNVCACLTRLIKTDTKKIFLNIL